MLYFVFDSVIDAKEVLKEVLKIQMVCKPKECFFVTNRNCLMNMNKVAM